MKRFWGVLSFLLLAMLTSADGASAALPSTFRMGFLDDVLQSAPPTRDIWMARARDSNASLLLLNVSWRTVAPTPPSQALNPADPAYNWTLIDGAVKAAVRRGLAPVLRLYAAPDWAEGKDAPPGQTPGAWRPDTAAFGIFAQATAQRYSGQLADPAVPGSFLPRVSYFQAWNEPNLSTYLAPQWVAQGGQLHPEAPRLYRDLLNAGYFAVKRVNASNIVVGVGTAPFGDPPGGGRMTPVTFVRELFRSPTRFDVLGADPYAVGSPEDHALGAESVSVPDLGKLTRIVRTAERRRLALPHKRHRLWSLEFGYDGSPPDPDGVPERKRARWLAQAMYIFWRQGAEAAIWLLIQDKPPVPDFASTSQSGLYFLDGRAKLSQQAYRFPFVTARLKSKALQAWARAPVRGTVRIQLRRHRRWQTLATVRVRRANAVVVRALRLRHAGTLRATVGSMTSVPWVQND